LTFRFRAGHIKLHDRPPARPPSPLRLPRGGAVLSAAPTMRRLPPGALLAGFLLAVAFLCVAQLRSDEAGIVRESLHVGDTPVTVYRTRGAEPAPVVVVAHGFAGSRRLMEPLALALAGHGYVVATFDFLGHGEHPRPMRGDLMSQDGTPALLVEQTGRVVEAALALPGVDGR